MIFSNLLLLVCVAIELSVLHSSANNGSSTFTVSPYDFHHWRVNGISYHIHTNTNENGMYTTFYSRMCGAILVLFVFIHSFDISCAKFDVFVYQSIHSKKGREKNCVTRANQPTNFKLETPSSKSKNLSSVLCCVRVLYLIFWCDFNFVNKKKVQQPKT